MKGALCKKMRRIDLLNPLAKKGNTFTFYKKRTKGII